MSVIFHLVRNCIYISCTDNNVYIAILNFEHCFCDKQCVQYHSMYSIVLRKIVCLCSFAHKLYCICISFSAIFAMHFLYLSNRTLKSLYNLDGFMLQNYYSVPLPPIFQVEGSQVYSLLLKFPYGNLETSAAARAHQLNLLLE